MTPRERARAGIDENMEAIHRRRLSFGEAREDLETRIAAAIETVQRETLEAAARVADEWASDGSTEYSKMTGRSIAGRIRALAPPPTGSQIIPVDRNSGGR